MRTQATKTGDEPIPGYTLRKRLGAGGYGEVWLADAPGGLQKAIKLVFGAVNESHAASELKSLQRIRSLNHPFLLSLERIEIVDNQVVIVTELAESSLLDRFEHYRRKGEPGIPRAMLLEFVRDTADALDFLAQKHFLQHLDIKPGNLLIVADRIKVGDFGLVKDLHDQNQSLIGGLTPTYSAPEIFDGRPDHRSDQYSLAIVYMEMLSGRLPFSGKTTGELARQHLNQAPELEALPPADRAVIARALSKNPLDRFSSCRALVDQLHKNRGGVPNPIQSSGAVAADGDRSKRTGDPADDTGTGTTVDPNRSSTPVTVGVEHRFHERLTLDGVQGTWQAPRCLFIGVGGMGCEALASLRASIHGNVDATLSADDHGWVAIDTNSETLSRITEDSRPESLPIGRAIEIPIYAPATYRKLDSSRFSPLSRRWLYNIPKSRRTEGVRPLSILSLLHHYEAVRSRINAEIGWLMQKPVEEAEHRQPIHVYLISSLHGGTGGGLLCELGFLVRQAFREIAFNEYRLTAIASAAMTANCEYANLPSAAAMCCLSELQFCMSGDQELAPLFPGDTIESPNSRRPFDWVTLVDGGLFGKPEDAETAIDRMAGFALADSQSMLGALMAEHRIAPAQSDRGWLRAGCADRIQTASRVDRSSLARWCLEQSLSQLVDYMLGPREDSDNEGQSQSADLVELPATVSGDLPLTNEASKDFTRRLLKDLGVNEDQLRLNEIAGSDHGNAILSSWARRLSPAQQELQMREDIETWKRSISTVIQMRVYNWRQIEQIQLNVIEGLLDFCDHRTQELESLFEPFAEVLGPAENMPNLAAAYLRKFTQRCFTVVEVYRREGQSLARKLERWNRTLSAERAQHETNTPISMATLAPPLQTVAKKIVAVLNSVLNREVLQVLDRAFEEAKVQTDLPEPSVTDSLDLRVMLDLSTDQVELYTDESNMVMSDDAGEPAEAGVSLAELSRYYPTISRNGGTSHRFVVAPVEQMQSVENMLEQLKLAKTTTCIPSTESMGTLAVCESQRIAIHYLVSSLWRPNSSTIQLAERLHSRVDVDWDPIGQLLESESGNEFTTETPDPAAAAIQNASVPISTMPVPSTT